MRLLPRLILMSILGACSMENGDDIDRLFSEYNRPGMPGAAVMVIRDGQPVLTRSYGLARLEEGESITPATNFRLASVTKQFTATAVLMLVDRGKLGLDDTLRQHYPQYPPFADGITVRHLLQHNSGIEDYEPIYGDPFPEQIRDRGVLELLSETEDTYFEPGDQYRYSNSGYAILATLIEDLSGEPFADFLRSNIFEPLGMDDTVAFVKGYTTVANRAFGYAVEGKVVEYADQSAWSAVLGDGGVYSSLNDLLTWDRALYDNELLPAALWTAAWTPGLENYGFGWRIDEYGGHRRLHHSGSTSGFRNFMQRFPDLGLTVIVLTNRAGPDVQPLAEKVADQYL